jgi:hypothetical protein
MRLLGAVNLKTPFGFRDHRLMQLALNTGLRVSELSHLDIQHVAQDGLPRQILDLPAPLAKRHKARLIPLNAVARRLIAELLAFNRARGLSVDPSAPLLQNRHHQRLSVRAIQLLVKHYREQAKLDVKVTPHSVGTSISSRLMRTLVIRPTEKLSRADLAYTQTAKPKSLRSNRGPGPPCPINIPANHDTFRPPTSLAALDWLRFVGWHPALSWTQPLPFERLSVDCLDTPLADLVSSVTVAGAAPPDAL